MIRTIVFFSGFGLSLFFSGLAALIHMLLGALHLDKLQDKHLLLITRTWAKSMLFITGNHVRVINDELVPDVPVLYVVNHQSNFDIPVCMAHLPHYAPFIAKIELAKVPVMSYWMKQMKCLFMDRKNMRQTLKVILEGIDMLKDGNSLVVFPEGTRAPLGDMLEFKPGSLKLAVKANVPIVPVTIKNTYKLLEEYNRVRKADVSITFHEPIDTANLNREEINNLHNTVRDIIKTTLEVQI